MGNHQDRHRRDRQGWGFTLVELLVVIAIIGVLVGILLPALSRARVMARAAGTGTYLATWGRALELYAAENPHGYKTSGAFDHFRDGDIRKYGWVGDIINLKVGNPGAALDLDNDARINRTVPDYMNLDPSGITPNPLRWSASDLSEIDLSASLNGTQKQEMWDNGYNTNFVASWYLVRGDPTHSDGYSNNGSSADGSAMSTDDGERPLNLEYVENGNTQAARIPLLSSSRPIEQLTSTQIDGINDYVGMPTVQAGDMTVESFTKGMRLPFPAWAGGGGSEMMHEITDIYPVHGGARNEAGVLVGGFAQVLFADGHVDRVRDEGGFNNEPDGFLGPYRTQPDDPMSTVNLNEAAWDEVRDVIWLRRLTNYRPPAIQN